MMALADTFHISIHAPPRGATTKRWRPWVLLIFQFTPLREGRRRRTGKPLRRPPISIHAPPRGATNAAVLQLFWRTISIHAPPRGATISARHRRTPSRFQFTPLREGRPIAPRTVSWPFGISIHAPPRGATAVCSDTRSHLQISIHAPPRGATRCYLGDTQRRDISIHAPPRGATAIQGLNGTLYTFQFTPLREGRQNRSWRSLTS